MNGDRQLYPVIHAQIFLHSNFLHVHKPLSRHTLDRKAVLLTRFGVEESRSSLVSNSINGSNTFYCH